MGPWAAHVVTVSDGVHHGTRHDLSGDRLVDLLTDAGFEITGRTVVPDDVDEIVRALREATAEARLVVTTGGTGFGPRDVTPEATARVIERPAPGLVHLMLAAGIAVTPMAALSRPGAGAVGRSLVVNLPGSPKGATENLSAIIDVVPHALQLLAGDTEHPGGSNE
ncbi:MAG: MogA/MoaB family molybdenum cofactor biosynthesis protein [Acidimicrobiia bacterium]